MQHERSVTLPGWARPPCWRTSPHAMEPAPGRPLPADRLIETVGVARHTCQGPPPSTTQPRLQVPSCPCVRCMMTIA